MRFAFTDEQDMLRAAVRGALARARPLPVVRAALDGSGELLTGLAEAQGWSGIGIPEEAGGQGGGVVELAILCEELGRAAVPDAFVASTGFALPLLAAAGADPILIAALAEGRQRAAVVWRADAMPAAGRVEAGPADVPALSGEVRFVLEAAGADVLVVPARARGGPALYTIDVTAAGVDVSPLEMTDRTRSFAHVTLDDAPATRLTGPAGPLLQELAARATVLTMADSLGAARRLLQMTVEYVGQRRQFGKPIGSFQAVKHLAAEMLVDLEPLHSAVYFAAWALDAGTDDRLLHAASAGAYGAPAMVRVADRALALHGAIGFTWEHDLHLFLKRVHGNSALVGGAGAQLDTVARALGLVAAAAPGHI